MKRDYSKNLIMIRKKLRKIKEILYGELSLTATDILRELISEVEIERDHNYIFTEENTYKNMFLPTLHHDFSGKV